ncbi:MAG TPA: zf-HC2 domain-containing protein [Gemmatimonadales bacterium]|nr:zf-HC2 domain-containing protein [Gemmatimonadales bacterium]
MTDPATISCEEALRLLALYLDHELTATERAGVRRHLERCRSCYSRAEFERRLKSEIRRVRREEVPPAFEGRIRRLLHEFTRSPAGRRDDAPGRR